MEVLLLQQDRCNRWHKQQTSREKGKREGQKRAGKRLRYHWQMMRVAPESLHCFTMSRKYCFSVSRRDSNFSTVSISTCSSHTMYNKSWYSWRYDKEKL